MNKEQFKNIFDKYFDAVRGFVYYRTSSREVAEDIAQDVFTRVWEKRERLEDSNIKALLYKMAADRVVSHYRQQDVRLNFARDARPEGTSASPLEQMQFHELKRHYAEALEVMSEGQRVVFLMSREESLKYHEIAERLGLSVKAVEKRMGQALQVLKSKLIYLLIWIAII